MQRFLQRLWRNAVDEDSGVLRVSEDEPSHELLRQLHRTIAGVADDMEHLRFNTAIAKLIELNNQLTAASSELGWAPRAIIEPLVQMTAPLAPHIAEELWHKLGHGETIVHSRFPIPDAGFLVADTVEYPIQVNGKVRSRVSVPSDASESEIEAAALSDERIAALLAGSAPKKVIVVTGRMVNLVV
jgi:leucyl-tRNA synthetase